MLGLRRAGRPCAGFLLLGVLTTVSLPACEPALQATPVPDQTETLTATQTLILASTPTPQPLPSPTATMAATQTPTSDAIPTPASLPDSVIAIEARLKSNPSIAWDGSCTVSSSANLPFHIGEITAHFSNVGRGDAGSFTVQLNNAVTETVDGLKAGASATVVVSTSIRIENLAVVDAASSVDESDESNNTAESFLPVPTLVPPGPTCTPSH